jgi:hypothetical protein
VTRKLRSVVILASLAFVSSQAYLAYLLGDLRPNILSLQLTFHAGRYWEILGLWGESGQTAYRGHFGYDGVHAVIYAVFGYLLATRSGLYQATEAQAMARTAWMLPGAALLDLLENLLQLQVLAGPFGAQTAAIPLSALCAACKWGLAAWFALRIGRRFVSKLGV